MFLDIVYFYLIHSYIYIYIYNKNYCDFNHICNIYLHILTKVTCELPCMLGKELEMSKNNNLDSKS